MSEILNVKPLVWAENSSQKSFVSEPFPSFKYVIVNDERGVDWGIGGDGWNPVDSVDEAKAAAQADYERRILSKIEILTAGNAEYDEMAAALTAILANHETVGAGASIFQCTADEVRKARDAIAKATA